MVEMCVGDVGGVALDEWKWWALFLKILSRDRKSTTQK
jgi:hypothetical protein